MTKKALSPEYKLLGDGGFYAVKAFGTTQQNAEKLCQKDGGVLATFYPKKRADILSQFALATPGVGRDWSFWHGLKVTPSGKLYAPDSKFVLSFWL